MQGINSAVLGSVLALHVALGCCAHHLQGETLAECDQREEVDLAQVSESHTGCCPLHPRDTCGNQACLFVRVTPRSRLLGHCDCLPRIDPSTVGPFDSTADQSSHIAGADELLPGVSRPVRLHLLKQVLLL